MPPWRLPPPRPRAPSLRQADWPVILLASHSPRQSFVAECQGDVLNATETRSVEHKYADFDTWVECIAVGVGIDEIISWIRLEFYFNGPSGRGQWLPVTGWRGRYFAGANETKRWNNQSWECEGAYDGQFRAQAYARAYLSNGAVIRLPEGSGYAAGAEPVSIDCCGLRVGAAGLPGAMVVRRDAGRSQP